MVKFGKNNTNQQTAKQNKKHFRNPCAGDTKLCFAFLAVGVTAVRGGLGKWIPCDKNRI